MQQNIRLEPDEEWSEEQEEARDNEVLGKIKRLRAEIRASESVNGFIDVLDEIAAIELDAPDFKIQLRTLAKSALKTMGAKVEDGTLKTLPVGTRDSVEHKQQVGRIMAKFKDWDFTPKSVPEFQPRDFAAVAQADTRSLPSPPKTSLTAKGSPYPFLLREIAGEDSAPRHDIVRGGRAKKPASKKEVKEAVAELGTKRPLREEASGPSSSVKAWKAGRPLKRVKFTPANKEADHENPPAVALTPSSSSTTPRAPR